MAQLPQSLRDPSSRLPPTTIVLIVVLLQALLLGGYFYLESIGRLKIEPDELLLLLVYTVIAIIAAISVGILRHRWMQRETRVRQRLLDVIDAIPDPAAVRDARGRYVMWNKAAQDYYGIKAAHVVGKTPAELFPPEVARHLFELDAQCIQDGKVVVRRLTLPPIYGKGPRVATIRVAPLRSVDDESNIRGVVTILHDITQAEQEAAALIQMSTQLRLALDTSGFGSWIWDLDNNTATLSPQFERLLRYLGDSFKRDFHFKTRLHSQDAPAIRDAVRRSLKENIPFDEVFRLQCFDAEYRQFHASGEVAYDAQGRRYFAGLLCPLDRNA